MDVRSHPNILNVPCGRKPLLDAADTCLASFYLCQLLDERFSICPEVSCFWSAVLKLALHQ
jgi:hypothetical protein